MIFKPASIYSKNTWKTLRGDSRRKGSTRACLKMCYEVRMVRKSFRIWGMAKGWLTLKNGRMECEEECEEEQIEEQGRTSKVNVDELVRN